jgi:hypothetical protein
MTTSKKSPSKPTHAIVFGDGVIDVKKLAANDKDDEFDVEKNAIGVKQHNKPSKGTPQTKNKPAKPESISRMQAIGIVMRKNPKETDDNIIRKADLLYAKASGKESNMKESALCYSYIKRFMKGYNA